MMCPVCDGAGGFAHPVAEWRDAGVQRDGRPLLVVDYATWGAADDCACCLGAGWLSLDAWRAWRARPHRVAVAVLNRAARARRVAA